MKTIRHIFLYSIIGIGFFLGSYSSAQVFVPDEEESTRFNVVESVNGANVKLDNSVVANKVGQPMFHWYGQLLNVSVAFMPVFIFISFFWLIYGYVKHLRNKNDLNDKKSLDNR